MHKEILTEDQIKLFPLLEKMGDKFVLVGGTAIALHLGHRRSIDFDLFSLVSFKSIALRRTIENLTKIDRIFVDEEGEFTFFSAGVKITFLNYPFELKSLEELDGVIKIPNLLTLAAMKAYALGRRAKWKDYVDLYFIIKDKHSLMDIVERGQEIFGGEFNEKIFRTQLAYFTDIDYAEEVEFLPGFEVGDEEIKEKLIEFSLS
ncbi:MAG: nucleotidyl transferase AbiEii/AbiGii toxin family protein [Patescibacteria group bacterium]